MTFRPPVNLIASTVSVIYLIAYPGPLTAALCALTIMLSLTARRLTPSAKLTGTGRVVKALSARQFTWEGTLRDRRIRLVARLSGAASVEVVEQTLTRSPLTRRYAVTAEQQIAVHRSWDEAQHALTLRRRVRYQEGFRPTGDTLTGSWDIRPARYASSAA